MRSIIFLAIISFWGMFSFAQRAPAIADSLTLKTSKTKTIKVTPVKTTDIKSSISAANNITDNLAHTILCSRFYKALCMAGLTETFKSKGPITLFVPLDSAFNTMPPGKMDTLLKPAHLPELIALITYHGVAGKLTSREISKQVKMGKGMATFTTLAGGKVTLKINADRNMVLTDENGGQSTITVLDLEQSNGTLFMIDHVLIPKPRLF